MKKIIIIKAVGITLLLFFGMNSFGQKLISNGYKIVIKSSEKKETRFHSKIYITYKGFIKVSSRDSLKGIYEFVYIDLGEDLGNLTFKNKLKSTVPPKLLFEAKSGTFSYNTVLGEEKFIKTTIYLPLEEVVLKGMLNWLKIKKELPLD